MAQEVKGDQIHISEGDCPNSIGLLLEDSCRISDIDKAVTTLILHVDRSKPEPCDFEKDLALELFFNSSLKITVDPCPKSWQVFEQAVLECAFRKSSISNGSEIINYWAGYLLRGVRGYYFGNNGIVQYMQETLKRQYAYKESHIKSNWAWRHVPEPDDYSYGWTRRH